MNMTAKVELITPNKAKSLLAKTKNMRKLNLSKAQGFRDDMTLERWEDENGESIKLATDDAGDEWVKDGQNRLWAIAESGTSHRMVVVRGIAGDRCIDVGEKRTLAQVLSDEGHQYPAQLSAATSNILHLLHYQAGGNRRPDITHAMRIAAFREWETRLKKVVPVCHNQKGLLWKSAVAAVLTVGSCSASYKEAKDDFIYYLGTGEDMEHGDPVFKLRELMLKDARNKSGHLTTRHRLALVAKAWNAHRDEMLVESLWYRSGGKKPESFPKVK